ncbi:hypothetical protein BGZ67_001190 [Mortierella alpina]|nr:hypothetical protein BGZ67_001190 [Mortierella alpina]
MPGLRSLATQCDAYGKRDATRGDGADQQGLGLKEGDAWESGWEKELDERISHIERPNIFDSFHDPHNKSSCDLEEHNILTSSTSQAAARESAVSTSAQGEPRGPDTYTQWNNRSIFGSLSHPAGSSISPTDVSKNSKNTTEVEFELPALTKRPRDILDECLDRDESVNMEPNPWRPAPDRTTGETNMKPKLTRSDKRPNYWRALGTPQQHDVSIARSQESAESRHKHGKPRLTWEMSSTSGPKEQSDKPFVSPYITEAGTPFFEAAYERHTKYAFKFRPTGASISREKLVESVFLLLGGTSSSVFAYNPSSKHFETGTGGIRIEGCSIASMHNLLQDLMTAGTHMKRLCHVADTCINHSEGMGLIRIAFGRSLSSYLTFLQGLDPFGEFFVESKHGWSWDGAEPIILGDPLDYKAEFCMQGSVKPAGFISERLAERVLEAGKELQILIEFEPRHPLIAHDRNSDLKSNGFKWLYAQSDIVM